MEYIKSGLTNILGGSISLNDEDVAVTTIEKLVDKLDNSLELESRQDAVRGLRAMSKKFGVEVGAHAMDALVTVLQKDKNDAEIVGYILDTLYNIMSIGQDIADEDVEAFDSHRTSARSKKKDDTDLGCQFTEIFLKQAHINIALLIQILDDSIGNVECQYPCIRLLEALLHHQPSLTQHHILNISSSPHRAIHVITNLLQHDSEFIRSEAVILIILFTRNNTNVQNIVAYENTFDRLLSIISNAGYSDGGVLVSDCCCLLMNLLVGNASNTKYFCDGGFLPLLIPYFTLPQQLTNPSITDNDGDECEEVVEAVSKWAQLKHDNIQGMLDVIRTLIRRSTSQLSTTNCSSAQQAIYECGLSHELFKWLLLGDLPANTLSALLLTLGDLMYGNESNQHCFTGIKVRTANKQSTTSVARALMSVLLSENREEYPLYLKLSCLYCLQAHLYQNMGGREAMATTFLPRSMDNLSMNVASEGHLICRALHSNNPTVNWLACILLICIMYDDSPCNLDDGSNDPSVPATASDLLLRVRMSTPAQPNVPCSMLQLCMRQLQQPSRSQVGSTWGAERERVTGLCMLLCVWSYQCPRVSHLILADGKENMGYLMNAAGGLTNVQSSADTLILGLHATLLAITIYNVSTATPSGTLQEQQLEEFKSVYLPQIKFDKLLSHMNQIRLHDSYIKCAQSPYISADNMLIHHHFTGVYSRVVNLVTPLLSSPANLPPASTTKPSAESSSHILQQQVAQLMARCEKQEVEIARLMDIIGCRRNVDREVEELRLRLSERESYVNTLKQQLEQLTSGDSRTYMSTTDTDKAMISEKNMLLQRLEQLESAAAAAESSKRVDVKARREAGDSCASDELKVLRDENDSLLVLLSHLDDKMKRYREIIEQNVPHLLPAADTDDCDDDNNDSDDGMNQSPKIESI